jgi:hypothetical protein
MIKVTFKPKEGVRSSIYAEKDFSGFQNRWKTASYIMVKGLNGPIQYPLKDIEKIEECEDHTKGSGQSST